MAKVAKAVRTDGNIYDVFYPGISSMDKNVPARYLLRLVAEGYTVEVDNRGFDRPRFESLKSW